MVCGLLGALSGADRSSKIFRRFLMPISITGFAFWITESIFTLTIMSMSVILGLGYGIPDATDPKPSTIGLFFFKLSNGNIWLANISTRILIGKLLALSLISIPIIKHNWITYGLCSFGIILSYAIISWRDLGTYYLFGRQLSWTETIIYLLLTLFSIIIILK